MHTYSLQRSFSLTCVSGAASKRACPLPKMGVLNMITKRSQRPQRTSSTCSRLLLNADNSDLTSVQTQEWHLLRAGAPCAVFKTQLLSSLERGFIQLRENVKEQVAQAIVVRCQYLCASNESGSKAGYRVPQPSRLHYILRPYTRIASELCAFKHIECLRH
jgi:hypothetical protein